MEHYTLITAGAVGGLAYAVRSGTFTFPGRVSAGWKVGFLGDILHGVIGAYVIYLLLPFEIEAETTGPVTSTVKFVALALLGGYAGRMIIDRALEVTIRKLEAEVEQQKISRPAMSSSWIW